MRSERRPPTLADLIAETSSPARLELLHDLDRLAGDELPILLLGETGAGKTHLAEAIHVSSRRNGAFSRVVCPDLSAQLIEDELFGHVRGAYTDARHGRKGKVLAAHGGTLFLDEVCDLPLDLQRKLLGVLDRKEFCPLGSDKPVRSEFRLVAATNKDLPREVAEGRFRKDLAFRMGPRPLWVAPLRECAEDIPAWARSFLAEACAERGLATKVLNREALAVLAAHVWPGNVRELKQVMELCAVSCGAAEVVAEDVGRLLSAGGGGGNTWVLALQDHGDGLPPLAGFLREIEWEYVVRLHAITGGDKRKAAEMAGVDLRTIQRKWRELGL